MAKKKWKHPQAEPPAQYEPDPALFKPEEPAKEEPKHHEGDRPPLHRKHPFSRAFEG